MGTERCSLCGGVGTFSDSELRDGQYVYYNRNCTACGGTGTIYKADYPSGETGCFSSSSRVLTPKGWRKIATINPGDPVLSYDPVSKKIHARDVTKKKEHPPTRIWELYMPQSSEPVCTTSCHPFLTKRGWIAARRLKSDDALLTITEDFEIKFSRVGHVERTARLEPVYNLHTAIEHTFVVAGHVVHNFAYCRVLRTWWNRHFIDPQEPEKRSWFDPVPVFSD